MGNSSFPVKRGNSPPPRGISSFRWERTDPSSSSSGEHDSSRVRAHYAPYETHLLANDLHLDHIERRPLLAYISHLEKLHPLLRPGEAAMVLNHFAKTYPARNNNQKTHENVRRLFGVVGESLELRLTESGEALATLANAFAVANIRDVRML